MVPKALVGNDGGYSLVRNMLRVTATRCNRATNNDQRGWRHNPTGAGCGSYGCWPDLSNIASPVVSFFEERPWSNRDI